MADPIDVANNDIRKNRLAKNLSQDKVAEQAGLTYSQFVRIEAGTGKTTEAEVKKVLKAIRELPANTRRIAGRPFADAAKRAEVEALRTEPKAPAAKKAAAPTKKASAAKGKRSLADALP